MIYSFDIFDTCLARLCGEPHNLYDVLSKKVIKLMRARVASICANYLSGREDVPLEIPLKKSILVSQNHSLCHVLFRK